MEFILSHKAEILGFLFATSELFKLKKEIESSNKKAEELKNAKSVTDIDNAFDNLP